MSGVWVGLTNLASRGLQLGQLVVLAALLSPRDFGLMGIALLSIDAIRNLTDLGIKQALIYNKRENVDAYLNTAFTLHLARGLLIFTVVFVTAPLIGELFQEPRSTLVIQLVALGPVLSGLQNPAVVYFEKDLKFHKHFVLQVSAALIGTACAIAYALVYRNVWALVVGVLVAGVVRLVVSYAIDGYRPWPELDVDRAREIVGYGKWITGLGIVVFLANQGDDAFVGWFLGASALGLYQIAYRLSNAPATELTKLIARVAMPAYSQIQDDEEKLREGFFRTLQLTTFVAVPAAVGIAVVAPTFVSTFLGPAWLPAVPVIQVLALWGLFRAVGSLTGSLFQAVGRPDYPTKVTMGKVVLMAIFIYPASAAFGIVGTAAVIVLSSALFTEPLVYYLAMNTVGGSYRRLGRTFLFPVLAGLLMGAGVLLVRELVTFSSGVLELVVLVGSGVVLYVLFSAFNERYFDYGMASIVRTIRTSLA